VALGLCLADLTFILFVNLLVISLEIPAQQAFIDTPVLHVLGTMDIVGSVASILQIIGAVSAAFGYIKDVRGSSKERQILAAEAANLRHVLDELKILLCSGSINSNLASLQSLCMPGGAIDQAKNALQGLTALLLPSGTTLVPSRRQNISDMTRRLVWPAKKPKVVEVLQQIERSKTLISLLMQQDAW
jgi:hypothetical protein